MIKFVTLNSIITDLLEIIRQAKISRSEPISKRQLEAWVHQYRALLLKRDLDKGKMPNPDYIQEIPAIELEVVDRTDGSNIESNTYMLKSKLAIPNTIDLNHKPGYMYVGTMDGFEFQFIPEGRAQWQQYKKYTNKDNLVFLRNGYLYLLAVTPVAYVTIRGIFEVPTEVSNFVNPNISSRSAGLDDPYPIPINLIPTLKELLLKGELGIQIKQYSDTTNNSAGAVSPNIEE